MGLAQGGIHSTWDSGLLLVPVNVVALGEVIKTEGNKTKLKLSVWVEKFHPSWRYCEQIGKSVAVGQFLVEM